MYAVDNATVNSKHGPLTGISVLFIKRLHCLHTHDHEHHFLPLSQYGPAKDTEGTLGEDTE